VGRHCFRLVVARSWLCPLDRRHDSLEDMGQSLGISPEDAFMIVRTLSALVVLALSTCAAAAQHRHHVHHAVLHHRAIPADAFAQARPGVAPIPVKPEIESIPMPRQRPFDLIWYDRVTSVIGGR